MTCPSCPIVWTKEDGPYPCAFLRESKYCAKDRSGWNTPCIPINEKWYYHSVKCVTVPCKKCKYPVEITQGELDRYPGIQVYCNACSEVFREMDALAAHIRGDC